MHENSTLTFSILWLKLAGNKLMMFLFFFWVKTEKQKKKSEIKNISK